ncbi:MAG: pirin-like C-terminal cupin domain-containing protein [Segetibacter sp.]
MITRKIASILNPKASQGFLGQGHTAIPVIDNNNFEQTDPFIALMDDQLNLPGNGTVGGAHPHAGFEIVTLVLEGDPDSKSKYLQTGGLEWMTAGSGIVHFEEIKAKVKMRILQLWLVLPKAARWTEPKWQELHLNNVPIKKDGNSEIRVYSGTSLGMTGPILNETPTTIVDFKLEAGYEVVQEIPASYNGFIYVIAGTVEVGNERTVIEEQQVAWLDKPGEKANSQVKFKGGQNGSRFIFYAGEPQGAPILSQGPFIGDTKEDIARLYQEYRQGKMVHVRNLPQKQLLHHA